MVEEIFKRAVQSPMDTYQQWKWAFEHPYLFTFIKIGTPSVYAIILYVGSKVVATLFKR